MTMAMAKGDVSRGVRDRTQMASRRYHWDRRCVGGTSAKWWREARQNLIAFVEMYDER